MTYANQRVNYDLIAHLYDEPGRDYVADPNLSEFIKEKAGQQTFCPQILDMGCGTGKQLTANHKYFSGAKATGLDLSYRMLLQARKRCPEIDWVQGNSANPPFSDDRFDYITNQFSYHHIPNKDRLISETYRILKPGGRLVITNLDPWSMTSWIVYTFFPESMQRDFADFFTMDQLTALMRAVGFCDIRTSWKHSHNEENLNDFLQYAFRRHRTSQLMAIQDVYYEAGIAKLREAVAKLGLEACVSSEICLVWIMGDKPR